MKERKLNGGAESFDSISFGKCTSEVWSDTQQELSQYLITE